MLYVNDAYESYVVDDDDQIQILFKTISFYICLFLSRSEKFFFRDLMICNLIHDTLIYVLEYHRVHWRIEFLLLYYM